MSKRKINALEMARAAIEAGRKSNVSELALADFAEAQAWAAVALVEETAKRNEHETLRTGMLEALALSQDAMQRTCDACAALGWENDGETIPEFLYSLVGSDNAPDVVQTTDADRLVFERAGLQLDAIRQAAADSDPAHRLDDGMDAWTPVYQDVLRLRARYDGVRRALIREGREDFFQKWESIALQSAGLETPEERAEREKPQPTAAGWPPPVTPSEGG